MRRSIIIGLLFIITVFSGCSNINESNQTQDTAQPLTQAQINEIITAATESLIVDVDLSSITKPDPAQQAEINQRMKSLGEMCKGTVTIENKDMVIARVNGEPITASDWYWEKNNKTVQAEYKQEPVPSDEEIFDRLIQVKAITGTARNLGLYPPEEQVKAYIADQRKYMDQLQPEEIIILMKSWDISEEEYFLLMEDRFADSLAKVNWGVYLNKYGELKDDQGYVVKSPLWIDNDTILPLLEEMKVEITSEGRQLGISY